MLALVVSRERASSSGIKFVSGMFIQWEAEMEEQAPLDLFLWKENPIHENAILMT